MAKPIIPREVRNADWPKWDFLSEEQQTAYEEAIKKYPEEAFDSLNISRKGSNLWKVLLLNQEGIATTLSLPQLDDLADAYPNDFENHYGDAPTVALRSAVSPYSKQLLELLENPNLEHTLIIEGLGVEPAKNYPDGLKFKKTGRFNVVPAADFDHKNHGRKFWSINPNYTVNWVKNDEDPEGSRTFYTREDDTSRIGVNWDLFVDSDNTYFRNSYPDGRVVVLSAEGASQNFDSYISELQQEREAYFDKLRALRDRISAELPQ